MLKNHPSKSDVVNKKICFVNFQLLGITSLCRPEYGALQFDKVSSMKDFYTLEKKMPKNQHRYSKEIIEF